MPFDPLPTHQTVQPLEEWRQVLLDAANIIQERGWCKHKLVGTKGQVCATGALVAVHLRYIPPLELDAAITRVWYEDTKITEAHRQLRVFLRLPKSAAALADWNNAPGMTKKRVIAAMVACALHQG